MPWRLPARGPGPSTSAPRSIRMASVMERPNGDGVVALSRCADRDAVGLKPSQDRSADVLGWPLEPCGCGSIDCGGKLSRAENRQPGIVFGSHRHGRYLT